MKISVAQTRPFKGEIAKNIELHKRLIDLAAAQGADAVFFPELSLTSYKPDLAKVLAASHTDSRLDVFQTISDTHKIIIGVGMPTTSGSGIYISMILFQPDQPRQTYSKQYLHEDELPYFISGKEQLYLSSIHHHKSSIHHHKLAPAICYESLLPEHAGQAHQNGADVYIASVAKPAKGVEKAFRHYPEIAARYAMTVLMANCTGPCDNFISAGQTAVWNKKGELVGQLDEASEGVLIFDTATEKIIMKTL